VSHRENFTDRLKATWSLESLLHWINSLVIKFHKMIISYDIMIW
jgi:hypothetical protein